MKIRNTKFPAARRRFVIGITLCADAMSHNLNAAAADLDFVATHSVLCHAINARSPQALAHATDDSVNFVRSMGIYDQLSWIDEPGILTSLKRLLHRDGYHILIATRAA